MQEMQEKQVRSLGWKDVQEQEMAIHPSILAWKTPWTEKAGGLELTGSQRRATERARTHTLSRPCLAYIFNKPRG